MNVKLIKKDNVGEVLLEGRIDAKVTPELEQYFQKIAEQFDKVVLDFDGVPYISSAGLRALRNLYVTMSRKGGSFSVRNVRKDVMDVFNVTGFGMLLNLGM